MLERRSRVYNLKMGFGRTVREDCVELAIVGRIGFAGVFFFLDWRSLVGGDVKFYKLGG